MRQLIDQLRKTASPIAVLLASREEDKVTIVAGISRELEQKGLNAGDWIRSAAEIVGGRGGGRADMAQAGGKHPEKLPAALDAAKARIKELLAK
jgi:alanyl-tRNA synthetase